mgnify:CR=1 FL=1
MQENKWLSMKEVCAYLHISRDKVMNWIIYPMPKSFWNKNKPIAYGY